MGLRPMSGDAEGTIRAHNLRSSPEKRAVWIQSASTLRAP